MEKSLFALSSRVLHPHTHHMTSIDIHITSVITLLRLRKDLVKCLERMACNVHWKTTRDTALQHGSPNNASLITHCARYYNVTHCNGLALYGRLVHLKSICVHLSPGSSCALVACILAQRYTFFMGHIAIFSLVGIKA